MLQKISDHVWMMPPDSDPAKIQPMIGAVITPTRTVLIDAGNSPSHARQMLTALQEINAPPVGFIIYTHHHWDHHFGAKVYGVPVVAQAVCHQAVVDYAKHPWSPEHLLKTIEQIPALKMSFTRIYELMQGEWDTWEMVLPTTIIEHPRAQMPLDGITLEIEHVGGNHAADSTVITVLEDSVMFLGDCFYPPPAHLKKPEDTIDAAMLHRLLDRGHNTYIASHGGAYAASVWKNWIKVQGF